MANSASRVGHVATSPAYQVNITMKYSLASDGPSVDSNIKTTHRLVLAQNLGTGGATAARYKLSVQILSARNSQVHVASK